MLPSRGRPGLTLLMTVKRELTPLDLIRLSTEDVSRTAAPVIQRLRASHHAAARHLANGKSIRETAALVGRTPQRIGDLTRDPTFQELQAYYETQRTDVDLDRAEAIQADLVDVAELAVHEMQARLEDPAKLATIPIGELRQVAALGLDRTVAPPKQAVTVSAPPTQITFNMGTRDLRPKVITQEGEAVKGEEE